MTQDTPSQKPRYITRLAKSEDDFKALYRLRYDVFVTEMGADSHMVDHEARRESDRFDAHCDHLILIDSRIDPQTHAHVIGTYRLLPTARAAQTGGFYSQGEFDITALINQNKNLLEVGRSCVARAYREGTAVLHLWGAIGAYVQEHNIEILFGVASFPETDPHALEAPLAYLHAHHLAPEHLRVRAIGPSAIMPAKASPQRIQMPEKQSDITIPPLIRTYLSLGGVVGEGAFIDHPFKTTDVCLILDIYQARTAQFGRPIKRWLQE